MKSELRNIKVLFCIGLALALIGVAGLAQQQRPINVGPTAQMQPNVNPFAGVPRPSASVTEQPDTTVTITIPAAFATALEKDRVDTLIPVPKKDGQGFDMQPLNADPAHHLMYLMLQDSGPLVQVFRKYPPAAVQTSVDAASQAARGLQDTINAARESSRKK